MKHSKWKQLLALVLALLFIVSLLPAAFAEDELPEADPETPVEQPEKELPAGICGMPEGYELSENQLAEKRALIEHDVAAMLESLVPGEDYVENEVLVTAATKEEAAMIAAAYNAELLSFNGYYAVLRLSGVTVYDAVIAGMDPDFVLPPVDPNYIVTLEPVEYVDAYIPIEEQFSSWLPQRQTWADWASSDPLLQNPSGNYQYMHDMVNSYAAWGVSQGWYPCVAVIDSGVDYDHQDLQWPDGGSKVICGYDFVDNDSDPKDENGHGTHCAGIIAAALGNGFGGAGIAPKAEILAVRVMDKDGRGSMDQICSGIYYAAHYGVDIINMSIGSYIYANTQQNAINYARNTQGALIVAAMGNDGTNVKQYPAALDGVIAVAAVNPSGERAPYSNYGKWCDIAAPGSDIWSTIPDDKYASMDGTSMAAPVVAGATALYLGSLGYNPGPNALEKKLLSSTNKCSSKDCGKGIIDASKLVSGLGKIAFDVFTYDWEYDEDDEVWVIVPIDWIGYSWDLKNIAVSPDTLFQFFTDPGDLNATYVFTLDGSTPSIANGEVKNGTRAPSVTMSDFHPGDKVTLKVMYVSGLGVASKVSTFTFTIAPRTADSVELADVEVRVHAPKVMIPGKTVKLSAALGQPYVEEGAFELDQTFTWKILSNSGCPNAKIDAKTGKLTTKAGEVGTVTVRATSVKYPSKYKNYTVKLQQINPIGTIKLYQKSLSIYPSEWRLIEISSLLDNKKNDVEIDARTYRWTSSNPKVVRVMQWYTDGSCEVQAIGKGSATITCEVLDGSGKKATCKVKVNPVATKLTITGQAAIAAGSGATYKAVLTPNSGEKVTWSLSSAPSGVTVDAAKGIVKVPSNVTSGTIKLRAETASGYCVAYHNIKIVSAKATSLVINNYSKFGSASYPLVTKKNGNIDTVTLYSMNTGNDSNMENELRLIAKISNNTKLLWTSSNTKVVKVYEDGTLCATGAGKATITCAAQDGSGKKATVKVTVVNPVSSIFVQSKNPAFRLQDNIFLAGIGKTSKNTAVFANTYGTPSNKKVTWSFEVFQEVWSDSKGTVSSRSNITSQAVSNGWVKLSTSGVLTVDKKIQSRFDSYVTSSNRYLVIYVYAKSQDGTNVTGTARYVVTPVTKQLIAMNSYYAEIKTMTLKVNNKTDSFIVMNKLDGYYGDYTISSSNPDIASAVVTKYYWDGIVVQVISGTKTGTARITIKANDGSNKSVSVTIKVTN